MNFHQKLAAIVQKNNSLVCVGLDSDTTKIPTGKSQFEFNQAIIDQTHDLVCAYKPNPAFYEANGASGVQQLKQTCDYLRNTYPQIPIIIDAKRGDIGNTNQGYMQYVFDYYQADAITVMPYMGIESLSPYFERPGKGVIVGCHSSNPGAKEFQDLLVSKSQSSEATGSRNGRIGSMHEAALRMEGKKLYQVVAMELVKQHGTNPNVMMFMGATYPKQLEEIRTIVGDMTLLIPGVGAQGGDAASTVKAGLASPKPGMAKTGLIINSSRSIIFANDPRAEAQTLRDQINRYR